MFTGLCFRTKNYLCKSALLLRFLLLLSFSIFSELVNAAPRTYLQRFSYSSGSLFQARPVKIYLLYMGQGGYSVAGFLQEQ